MRTVIADLEFLGVPGVFGIASMHDRDVAQATYEVAIYGPYNLAGSPPEDPVAKHEESVYRPAGCTVPWRGLIDAEFEEGDPTLYYRITATLIAEDHFTE